MWLIAFQPATSVLRSGRFLSTRLTSRVDRRRVGLKCCQLRRSSGLDGSAPVDDGGPTKQAEYNPIEASSPAEKPKPSPVDDLGLPRDVIATQLAELIASSRRGDRHATPPQSLGQLFTPDQLDSVALKQAAFEARDIRRLFKVSSQDSRSRRKPSLPLEVEAVRAVMRQLPHTVAILTAKSPPLGQSISPYFSRTSPELDFTSAKLVRRVLVSGESADQPGEINQPAEGRARASIEKPTLDTEPQREEKNEEQEQGQLHGMVVSSLTSVCLDPYPVVSFNVKRPSATLDAIYSAALHLGRHPLPFYLHIPSQSTVGAQIARDFTYGSSEEKFERAASRSSSLRLRPDQPGSWEICPDIPVVLTCNLMERKCVNVGDHVIVVARVRRVEHFTKQTKATRWGSVPTPGKSRAPIVPFHGLLYGHGDFRVWDRHSNFGKDPVVEAESGKEAGVKVYSSTLDQDTFFHSLVDDIEEVEEWLEQDETSTVQSSSYETMADSNWDTTGPDYGWGGMIERRRSISDLSDWSRVDSTMEVDVYAVQDMQGDDDIPYRPDQSTVWAERKVVDHEYNPDVDDSSFPPQFDGPSADQDAESMLPNWIARELQSGPTNKTLKPFRGLRKDVRENYWNDMNGHFLNKGLDMWRSSNTDYSVRPKDAVEPTKPKDGPERAS